MDKSLKPLKRLSKSRVPRTIACFDELRNAIDILNTNGSAKSVRTYCSYTNLKNENSLILDKTTIYYICLIKQAVAKHKWDRVCKLLLAYLDEPKNDSMFTQIVFNVALIYLLNDRVAQNNGTLDEFLQLTISCDDDKARKKLLKKIMMITGHLQ